MLCKGKSYVSSQKKRWYYRFKGLIYNLNRIRAAWYSHVVQKIICCQHVDNWHVAIREMDACWCIRVTIKSLQEKKMNEWICPLGSQKEVCGLEEYITLFLQKSAYKLPLISIQIQIFLKFLRKCWLPARWPWPSGAVKAVYLQLHPHLVLRYIFF